MKEKAYQQELSTQTDKIKEKQAHEDIGFERNKKAA